MHRDIPADFAPRPSAASLSPSPRTQALRLRRFGFVMAAAACAVAGAGLRWVDPGNGSLAAGAFALLALCALGCLGLPQRSMPLALTLLMGAIVLALAGSAAAMGWGLLSPGLVLLGLLVFALGAANGWPAALAVAALAALAVGGLYAGPLPSRAGQAEAPGALAWLVVHLVAIAVGLAGGAMASAALSRRLLAAGERERRFRGLLALAADAYWEVDAQYRLLTAVFSTVATSCAILGSAVSGQAVMHSMHCVQFSAM